jgi:hypothetical protein
MWAQRLENEEDSQYRERKERYVRGGFRMRETRMG